MTAPLEWTTAATLPSRSPLQYLDQELSNLFGMLTARAIDMPSRPPLEAHRHPSDWQTSNLRSDNGAYVVLPIAVTPAGAAPQMMVSRFWAGGHSDGVGDALAPARCGAILAAAFRPTMREFLGGGPNGRLHRGAESARLGYRPGEMIGRVATTADEFRGPGERAGAGARPVGSHALADADRAGWLWQDPVGDRAGE